MHTEQLSFKLSTKILSLKLIPFKMTCDQPVVPYYSLINYRV